MIRVRSYLFVACALATATTAHAGLTIVSIERRTAMHLNTSVLGAFRQGVADMSQTGPTTPGAWSSVYDLTARAVVSLNPPLNTNLVPTGQPITGSMSLTTNVLPESFSASSALSITLPQASGGSEYSGFMESIVFVQFQLSSPTSVLFTGSVSVSPFGTGSENFAYPANNTAYSVLLSGQSGNLTDLSYPKFGKVTEGVMSSQFQPSEAFPSGPVVLSAGTYVAASSTRFSQRHSVNSVPATTYAYTSAFGVSVIPSPSAAVCLGCGAVAVLRRRRHRASV